jgi:CRP-like cAMP-binding protein
MDSEEEVTEDVVASGDTLVAPIDIQVIEQAIGVVLPSITAYNQLLETLDKIYLFKCLPHSKRASIIPQLERVTITDAPIFVEGAIGDSIYIVESGVVQISKGNRYLRTVTAGSYFGERSILQESPRTATVVAQGEVVLLKLSQASFKSIIDDKAAELLQLRMELQDEEVELSELELCR